MTRASKVLAVTMAFAFMWLASCDDDSKGNSGNSSDTTSTPAPSTTDPGTDTTTTERSDSRVEPGPGVVTDALPSNFSYRVGGWTFSVNVAKVPTLVAEKTVDPTQPPGKFALTFRPRGLLAATAKSTDTGRVAPAQTLTPFLEYKNYNGPAINALLTSNGSPVCSNDFAITSAGMGGEVSIGLGADSIDRVDVLYCTGIGAFYSDPETPIAQPDEPSNSGPNYGDPLFDEETVDFEASYINKTAPNVYVDATADSHPPCRFRLAVGRVIVVGGPCELVGPDGNVAPEPGATLTTGQVWAGDFHCGTDTGAMYITIGTVNGSTDGVLVAGTTFDASVHIVWTPFGRDRQIGTYTVHGAASDPHTVTMTPGDWTDHGTITSYGMDTFNAEISGQQMDGTIKGCGTIGFGEDGPFSFSGTG